MRKIYESLDDLMTAHIKNVLDADGIDCVIRNEFLPNPLGAVAECRPEVWVLDDAAVDRARQIIEELLDPQQSIASVWRCPSCGESVEDQFTECWKCGNARPARDKP